MQGDERYDALIRNRYGVSAAALPAGQAGAIIKNEEKCIRCALCAQRCPTNAITMEALEQQEREVFDLFGVVFDGHPDLRRLLMWDEFEDHPMRRDYVNPDDYEYEPTAHDDVLQRANQHRSTVGER